MYGSGMGTLAVYLKKGNSLATRPIWSEAGNKGNEWRRATVTVKSTTTYQVWLYLLKAILLFELPSTFLYSINPFCFWKIV